MGLLTDQDKLEYENLINLAIDDFASKTMIWKRSTDKGLDRFGEDSNADEPTEILLKVLCNYNYMRSWPITDYTTTGEVDKQSIQVLISKKSLRDGKYLTSDGYFDYSPAYDQFFIDGVEYKASGDTPASQAFSDDLLFTLILTRPLKETRNQ